VFVVDGSVVWVWVDGLLFEGLVLWGCFVFLFLGGGRGCLWVGGCLVFGWGFGGVFCFDFVGLSGGSGGWLGLWFLVVSVGGFVSLCEVWGVVIGVGFVEWVWLVWICGWLFLVVFWWLVGVFVV